MSGDALVGQLHLNDEEARALLSTYRTNATSRTPILPLTIVGID